MTSAEKKGDNNFNNFNNNKKNKWKIKVAKPDKYYKEKEKLELWLL